MPYKIGMCMPVKCSNSGNEGTRPTTARALITFETDYKKLVYILFLYLQPPALGGGGGHTHTRYITNAHNIAIIVLTYSATREMSIMKTSIVSKYSVLILSLFLYRNNTLKTVS